MAAAQRCLEEFDTLLEASTFSSPTWAAAGRRLFDVSRVANMLLAARDRDANLSWAAASSAHAPLSLRAQLRALGRADPLGCSIREC